MTLRQKRRLLYAGIIALLILAVLVAFIGGTWLTILLLAALTGYLAAFFALWRCPYCRRGLGRIDAGYAYCPHCGKKLAYDKKSGGIEG